MSPSLRRPGAVRPIPARWRIVGWILLTTAITLIAVGFTVRSLLIADVARDANTAIDQEISEFEAFAAQGVDPTSAQPFTSAERLLAVYLSRQIPTSDEVLLGLVDDQVIAVDRSGGDNGPYDLIADTALLAELRTGSADSGVNTTPAGEMRWARVPVGSPDGGDAYLLVAVFTSDALDEADHTIRVLAAVALGGLLLTALFGWFVAAQILMPIRQVREVADSIQETDLLRRVPVEGRDDISQLAITFNSMLDRLARAHETQRRFVDDAGHELRTPITVIRGHLETTDEDPVSRAKTMRLVDSELDRMSRIVSDLLTLAKSERPDFVRPADTDLAELMIDVEAQAAQLGDRQWQLVEIAEGTVSLDSQRIMQAMLQLTTNAVQHTKPESRIRLGSRFSGGGQDRSLHFWVGDDGPGIEPGDTERIFARFDRGGGASHTTAGAGLGLSIVSAIARGHHGAAHAESALGQGATFYIVIPAPEGPQEP
ncbi:MAG TPA: HAMP domain-containing histidine kinase [Dietzia timorensis]|uniref:histidine kinase n=1 Tax=Dietzia timorensis TaxID=499555 RepID=A0A921JXS3_9ACTN|nr:HAMP domain-containing sensor histidine kinase [Dietzia timorensis]HJE90123.1 HAMP domain-containing histidine kinase [Dietzia timorensis]